MNEKSDLQHLENFIHNNQDLERLEEITEEFNIFTSLNIVSNEIRHSNFFSWLMDPNESHGLGDYFLHSFLGLITFKASALKIKAPSIFDIDSWNYESAEIRREWKNIDILILSEENKLVCAIENKIYSKEHSNQLERYSQIVKSEFNKFNYLFVYLTIEGDIPETPSSAEEYIPISYKDIDEIITKLINNKTEKTSKEIMTFIKHYQEMLRRYIMKDSEIQKICQRIYKSHKRAIDLIYEYRPDVNLDIYQHLIEEIDKHPDLILDESNKSYIRFTTKNLDFVPKEGKGWTNAIKRILMFEIKNYPKYVQLDLIIGPGNQDIRSKIYDVAHDNTRLFNTSNRKLSNQWFTAYKTKLVEIKTEEDLDWDSLKPKLMKKFKKFLETDLLEIEEGIQVLKSVF